MSGESDSSEIRTHRVAVVAACAFPSPRGSQVLVRSVVEQLAAVGHEVHLVTYAAAADYAAPAGVTVHATPRGIGAAPVGLGWSKGLYDLALLRVLRRVVDAARIEVIHAHNYEAPLLAYWIRARTGVPVVYHAHNALADELATYVAAGARRRFARWIGRRLDEQIPRRADHAIALTPELGEFLVRCGVDEGRLSVLAPAGLPAAVDANAACAGPGFVVTYAGNVDPYQDLDILGEAFVQLRRVVPTARLRIVTHADDWRRRLAPGVVELVGQGGAAVEVAPDYATVWARMAAADVLVCPRSSWSGFPIKLLNYASAGRPIVVAAGSAKGLVDGESALVVENRDPAALADALRRLYETPQLGSRLVAGARAFAAEIEGDAEFASQLGAIYGKIIAECVELRASRPSRRTRLRAWAGARISPLSPDGGPR